jgi:hypothetical protein
MIYDFFIFQYFVAYHCIACPMFTTYVPFNVKGNEVVNYRTGNTMTGDKTLKGKLKIDQHKPHLQPEMNS